MLQDDEEPHSDVLKSRQTAPSLSESILTGSDRLETAARTIHLNLADIPISWLRRLVNNNNVKGLSLV